jgi:molybdate transport system regulatory protein
MFNALYPKPPSAGRDAEVTLSIPGGRHVIAAVIAANSSKRLGLAGGLSATAVYKASSVFLASVE